MSRPAPSLSAWASRRPRPLVAPVRRIVWLLSAIIVLAAIRSEIHYITCDSFLVEDLGVSRPQRGSVMGCSDDREAVAQCDRNLRLVPGGLDHPCGSGEVRCRRGAELGQRSVCLGPPVV